MSVEGSDSKAVSDLDAQQFGIRGVYANPADVSTASGIVSYELSQPNW
jgi:hypothetical protein